VRILFLTITRIKGISERGIYTDLLRKFRDEGNDVFVACPAERRYHEKTSYTVIDGVNILNIWTLNAQKTSLIEKGLCTLFLDIQFKRAVKKYYGNIKFDLVLYSTPPITFTNTITYIKKKDGAVSYLLLKDIFPQNAVDLGMISKHGLIYYYFRKKEEKLYSVSDFIGCLSPANVDFLLKENPNVNPNIVEVNPNSIQPLEEGLSTQKRISIRAKYNIPLNSIVFIYGGNLGKPQGIDFIIKALSANNGIENIFIIVVGSGTEFPRLYEWFKLVSPSNILVMQGLPKNEYDELVMACDIGLVFLDRRFSIPNFPSRLLSYLENKMPVLAATDVNTDFGKIIVNAECGFWVESGDLDGFNNKIQRFIADPKIIQYMGENGYQFLLNNYHVKHSFEKIMNRIKYV